MPTANFYLYILRNSSINYTTAHCATNELTQFCKPIKLQRIDSYFRTYYDND